MVFDISAIDVRSSTITSKGQGQRVVYVPSLASCSTRVDLISSWLIVRTLRKPPHRAVHILDLISGASEPATTPVTRLLQLLVFRPKIVT